MHWHKECLYIWLGCYFFACSPTVWEKADMASRQGDLHAAEHQLVTHVNQHPTDARAYLQLASVRAELGDWQGMMQALASCEQLNPDYRRDAAAMREHYWRKKFNAGLKSQGQGEHRTAQAHFKATTIIFPSRPQGHRLLGEASFAAGDTLDALAAFERAIELDYNDHRARRLAMRLYFDIDEYRSAVHQADLLLQDFPNDIDALRLRAYSYDRLDNEGLATEAYVLLNGRSDDPADAEAFAAFSYRLGRYGDAASLLRLAIDRGGDIAGNLQGIAQARLMQQNFPELLKVAIEILAMDSTDIKGLHLKQIAHSTLGQMPEAEKTRFEYLKQLAQYRLVQKNYPDLLKTATELILSDSSHIEAMRLQVIAYDSTGQYDKARATEHVYLQKYGRFSQARKDYGGLLRTANRMLELDSLNANAVAWKMMAYDSLHQPHEALQTHIQFKLAQAHRALQDKEFRNVLARADDVLRLDPQSLRALELRKIAYTGLNQLSEARAAEIAYLQALGNRDFNNKDYQGALAHANAILELDPLHEAGTTMKKETLRKLGKHREASDTEVEFALATAEQQMQSGEFEKVVASADVVLAQRPKHLRMLELRYVALDSLGRRYEADAARIVHRLTLAEQQQAEQQHEALLQTSADILAIEAAHLRAMQLRTAAYRGLGQQEQALKSHIQYLHTLAQQQVEQRQHKALIETTSEILSHQPTDTLAVRLKREAHEAMGDRRSAAQTMIDYHMAVSDQTFKRKDYAASLAAVEKVLEIEPQNIRALEFKRTVLLASGNIEAAMQLRSYIQQLSQKK